MKKFLFLSLFILLNTSLAFADNKLPVSEKQGLSNTSLVILSNVESTPTENIPDCDCMLVQVTCDCGEWSYQWCTGSGCPWHNPVNDTANRICCKHCGHDCDGM
jgi:hypothetical protein